jgi:aspartate kinase
VIVSTGEQVSVGLLALAIRKLGGKARSFLGHQVKILTDSAFARARIVSIDDKPVRAAFAAGEIAVIAGFQGVDEHGNITTLGRGGSDTTGVAIAAALGADVCEIYTDVAGVFSADPRLVPNARKLPLVSFDEMLEMSSSGAGVLQLRSVEYARNHGIRIHCRSSFEDAPGTLVLAEDETMERPMVTAVTHAYEARVTLTGLSDEPGVAGRVFGALADANVNVDMIIQNEPISEDSKADLSFTVATDDLRSATDVLNGLNVGDDMETDPQVGKVSIVGAGMRSHPGVAAKVFRTLGERDINIEMISTSPIKISCVVAADRVPDAVRAIHEAFELGAEAVREEDPSGEHRPRVTS